MTPTPIETHYGGCRFRSRLEARWAVFFDALGIRWEYEREGYDLGGIWYLPDFWLPQFRYWIEIKGQAPTEAEWNKAEQLMGQTESATLPCLWFQRGGDHFHQMHSWLIDTVIDHSNAIVSTAAPPSDTYKWHKNPEAYISWLKAFTRPGDVVYDPFTGSGSLPIECKRLDRHFIASEIQPEIAARARERLDATQVVHPIFRETQQELAL